MVQSVMHCIRLSHSLSLSISRYQLLFLLFLELRRQKDCTVARTALYLLCVMYRTVRIVLLYCAAFHITVPFNSIYFKFIPY